MSNTLFEPGKMGQDDSTPADPTADPSATPAPAASGGFWSSITSVFSPAPVTAVDASGNSVTPDASTAAAVAPPDPSEMYSNYFSLGQLCPTSQIDPSTGQVFTNLPLDAASQANLRQLGVLLDAIHDNVGSFTIASAYRSQDVQNALRAGSGPAATMAVSKSFHSTGQAADITPTNGMTPTAFAQAIYNNPIFTALCGQLVDKSEGGNETSLHISTIVTTGTHQFLQCTPMFVNSAGGYVRMTPAQIGQWLSSSINQLDSGISASLDQTSEDDAGDDDSGTSGLIVLAALAALAGGGYLYYSRKK